MAVLIAILFALVATWTARSRDRTQALEATRKVLDEVVAAVDEARRKTRHDPGGPVEAIFLGDRIDAWGRPLQVDPGKAIVYSLGPDGLDQRGEGDDLVRYLPSLARSR